jgi:hypothetical protein
MVLGTDPADLRRDFKNIAAGVILMPIVIPWSYVYRHYVKSRGTAGGDRWVARRTLNWRKRSRASTASLRCQPFYVGACSRMPWKLFTRK